jgi:hypothetical protein
MTGKPPISFLEYLRGFEGSWLPPGEFLRGVLSDPAFPDVQSWTHLDGYLVVRRASPQMRKEAEWFWREYWESQDKLV